MLRVMVITRPVENPPMYPENSRAEGRHVPLKIGYDSFSRQNVIVCLYYQIALRQECNCMANPIPGIGRELHVIDTETLDIRAFP